MLFLCRVSNVECAASALNKVVLHFTHWHTPTHLTHNEVIWPLKSTKAPPFHVRNHAFRSTFFSFIDPYSALTLHRDPCAAYYDFLFSWGLKTHACVRIFAVGWNAREEHLKHVTEIVWICLRVTALSLLRSMYGMHYGTGFCNFCSRAIWGSRSVKHNYSQQ